MSPACRRSGSDCRDSTLTCDVVDGHDLSEIRAALAAPNDRLKVIVLRTVKGHGVSFMENEMKWHYLPLTAELYEQAIDEIGSR